MRVLFVSDHFVPPSEPGVLRTWQLARHLAEHGDEVTVVAPRAYFPFSGEGHPTRRASVPLPDGVRVSWMRTPSRGEGLARRVMSYGWQAVQATGATLRARDADVVVAGLTPSMLAAGSFLVARARGVPFVVDERDLALDAAEALRLLPPRVLDAARVVERLVHRRADAVVAVTPGIGSALVKRGIPSSRVHLVPNGYEDLPAPPPERGELRRGLGWRPSDVVLLYVGNLGVNHDLDVVLDSLALMRGERTRLAIMGEGELRGRYRRRAERERLPVEFLATRPKAEVAAVCEAADIGLLPLRGHPYFSCSLPNKIFEYLGAGLPVVLVGPEGDSSSLLDAAGAGVRVPAGEPGALAAALRRLAGDHEGRTAMGRAGKDLVAREWTRDRFVPEFRRALLAAIDRPAGTQLDEIRAAYRGYDHDPREVRKRDPANQGVQQIVRERWEALAHVVGSNGRLGGRVLDVGCGTGEALARLGELAGGRAELFGVDILADRVETLRHRSPHIHAAMAAGQQLPFSDSSFDLVLLSTVLSSIPDTSMRRAVGREVLRVLRPGGMVVCYDVRYPNPWNPNTRLVGRRELRSVFEGGHVAPASITVIPPLARSLGGFAPLAYRWLSAVPPLRSHYLTVVTPNGAALHREPVLFVTPANCRFDNMAVNQRLRALLDRGPVEVLSCHPASFPADVAARARIRSFPVSRSLRAQIPKLAAFSAEVTLWSLAMRMARRSYRLVYTFQDLSAVAGLVLRRNGSGWAMDVLDDPAQELSNAVTGGHRWKARALRLRDRLYRPLAPRPDVVFTIGSGHDDPLPGLLRDDYRVDGVRIVPLRQAVDVGLLRGRHRTTWPADTTVVLFVGYVSPLRGVDVLAESARLVRDAGLPLELHLVGHLKPGDEAWMDGLRRREPGLITYHGTLPSKDTLRLMAACSVGVLPFPARREMLPVQAVTGVEYLALGKPLVATDLPGARALVRDGTNGWLVTPGDPAAMAAALSRLCREPDLARRMGAESARLAGRFDIRGVNHRMEGSLSPWM